MIRSLLLLLFSMQLHGRIIIPEIQYAPHPRILLTAGMEQQLMQNISGDSIWEVLQQRTLKACDHLISTPPLQRIKEGKRILGISREALYRIFMLSYAYRTTGDRPYAQRATAELLAVCKYADWNPEHFLDVAEMTLAVSIGYDWLYETFSQSTREAIRDAIIDKGLKPSLDSNYNNFLTRDNNWNQVCNTAMAYGAMAIIEEQPALSKAIINRSIESIRQPMLQYAPDGAYPEGYGYWHYGTTYNVMLLALLEQTYGTDFGLSATPGFMKSPYYILHMISPTLLPFNFGDSVAGLRLNTSMFWFAGKLNDPALIQHEVRGLLQMKDYPYEQYSRMLPSIFIFGHSLRLTKPAAAQLPLMFVARNEAPVCLMRSAFDTEEAIYVGIKGGTPSANNHTHLDQGSFVMEALGVRWAIDLGPEDYGALEERGITLWDNSQKSQRWDLYRYNNLAHNLFSINDRYLNVLGRAEIKASSSSDSLMEATVDLSPMYNELNDAKRRIAIINKTWVAITDSLQTTDEPVEMTWRMLTGAKVTLVEGGFSLHQAGKSLFVAIPEGTKPFVTAAVSPHAYETQNPEVNIIGYRITLPPKSKLHLTVQLIPAT